MRDVSLDVHHGECLGLIGRNGSGKTTLLKTISGVIEPDEGEVWTDGRITALHPGAGFRPDLSGMDNIYLNGSVLGLTRREILAARLRSRLKEGKLAEAQQLLDEFRQLQTQANLRRDLEQFRQQSRSPDRLTQTRIDKLLADAQKILLLKPLSDELLTQLTRELSAARSK